ncbi:MAG: phosphoribosylformylglycinamidine cyclo-ligase [Treponema sp.]|jgi:phosphoribosylformylglycinamidine cyclo-ligase|nr:phosphoribosylformylglycinamidine cyclo-ligase [Treponema sp.]
MDYREAGVNIEEGYRAVNTYRDLAQGTLGALGGAVLGGIGSFAGMFALRDILAGTGPGSDSAPGGETGPGSGIQDPVLVSGTDGVGTKLALAFTMKKYDTVGIDCVAMCVNDILCHGARPLFFLDYLACGKLDAAVAAVLVGGAAAACRETGCVLLGGETAEMPGFYDPGKYDLAGFALGIVDRRRLVDGSAIREGDALIGIASSGPHSNGFSLIRKVLPNPAEDFGGMPLGRALLEPTRLYVKPALGLMEQVPVHGMAHITGGGFYENIPRMFPLEGGVRRFDAVIKNGAWPIPPIFNRIAAGAAGLNKTGAAAEKAGAEMLEINESLRRLMFNTFNMGAGFVIAVDKAVVPAAVEYLDSRGFPAWEIGEAAAGTGEVRFV